MKIDLEELERLEKAATPGPWNWVDEMPTMVTAVGDLCNLADLGSPKINITQFGSTNNARFIAAMRNNIKPLLEAVRVLEHALEMGHFTPGGSTENWAKEALAKLRGSDED